MKQAEMARASAGAKRFTADSFQNFEARVGIQTNNQSSASSYGFDFISRNRVQMEAMYRSSWIVGAVVDSVAEDMTRAGITVSSDLDPDDQQALDQAMERLQIWDALCDTTKWSRLYGGALAVMLIDGQKMDTPLNVDSVGEGQFKGLLVLDRWLVQPSLNELVQEYGPDMGKPKFYEVVADSMALKRQRIHYSRVLRVDGVDLPYWQKISENLWGQSVIERLFDRLLAFDSTTQGAAQLVYKAHLRTLKVKDLRQIIGIGGPALEGLIKQIDMIRRYQSNEGLTLLDASDEFQVDQYTFAGLDDVLLQMAQQLSGAAEIPLTRLFGQSPAGLSATGEGEMKQYHESINTKQERRLRMPLTRLLEVMARSVLGQALPKGWSFTFNSLQRMSDTEKSTIATATTTAILDANDSGVIDQATALKELKQASEMTGLFTNITDEMITEAENAPPPISEADPDANATPGQKEKPGADPGAEGRGSLRLATA
jgi:phage-related protein (TIGR01555 family)